MCYSLKTKLSLAVALIALMVVFVTGVLAKSLLEKHFSEYILQKQENQNKEIVSLIGQQYTEKGMWRADVVENIGVSALERGLIVKVVDSSNQTVWDAAEHNNGMCQQMIKHMADNMISRYPGWKGKYEVSQYPITSNFKQVGVVEIGYYGPFYFSDDDLRFINALNTALFWVTIFALIFSIFIGTLLAKRLTDPIGRVIHTAQMIAAGNYSKKDEHKTTTREINELVSAINNLAQALENQERLRKRLTADVAHELRTPMTTLQGHMEAMIDGIWEPTTDRLKSCHEEIIRINKLVGDLHSLAKYEGESLNLEKTKFNIMELISTIFMNFESHYKAKGVKLSYSGESQMIFADRDKLSQVIVNLISNGLKYTPFGGEVDIKVKDHEDHTKIIVTDNGQGIPEEDLPYIFERFYRADKSRNRSTGGSGIGLTIVKAVIEAHKGSIKVESKTDKGTKFIISIPKVEK